MELSINGAGAALHGAPPAAAQAEGAPAPALPPAGPSRAAVPAQMANLRVMPPEINERIASKLRPRDRSALSMANKRLRDDVAPGLESLRLKKKLRPSDERRIGDPFVAAPPDQRVISAIEALPAGLQHDVVKELTPESFHALLHAPGLPPQEAFDRVLHVIEKLLPTHRRMPLLWLGYVVAGSLPAPGWKQAVGKLVQAAALLPDEHRVDPLIGAVQCLSASVAIGSQAEMCEMLIQGMGTAPAEEQLRFLEVLARNVRMKDTDAMYASAAQRLAMQPMFDSILGAIDRLPAELQATPLQFLCVQVKHLPQNRMAQSLQRIIEAHGHALIRSDGKWPGDVDDSLAGIAASNISHLPLAHRKQGFDAVCHCVVQRGAATFGALQKLTGAIETLRYSDQVDAFLRVWGAACSQQGMHRDGLFQDIESAARRWDLDARLQAQKMVRDARCAAQ